MDDAAKLFCLARLLIRSSLMGMAMIIAVPTGVKIFTLCRGRGRLNAAMRWSLGFMATFVLAGLPVVHGLDAYWMMREEAGEIRPAPAITFDTVEPPGNKATGILLALTATIFGFSMIWHLWWLAVVGLLGTVAVGLAHAWNTKPEGNVSARDVAAFYNRKPAQKPIA